MQIHNNNNNNNNNINPKSNLTAQSLTPTKNPELADMRKMQDSQKIGVLRRVLNNIANAFRAIGESVTQANSGAPISMSISVKNLGIASNPARSERLNDAGVKNLKDHVTNLTPEKKQALVDSAVKDVANGGHNLLKLLNRKPDLFKTVVDAGGEALLHAMDTHSAKIPTKLLSEVSDHMPKYIRDQCVTEGDYGALTADFDKGATKIAGFFEMGVMSLHQALETIKALISTDVEGAMEKTGKDDMGEIFGGIREIVGTHGGAELRDGLAIRKQFEAMSRPGEIAGGVLDGLNSGGSLEDKEFRDSVNQALTAVGISLQFTGEEPNDTSVQKALKVISKQTGAGSGGDAMIFDRLTMPELKELKAMALLPDGQTQIEARLNRYSGATPEAATAIATACMETFLKSRIPTSGSKEAAQVPIIATEKPDVTKTEVGKISEIAQDSNREDMGIRRDAQLAADLWRNVSKLNLSFSSDSTTLLGKEGVGPKPILAALIQHDTGLDVAQRDRALSTLEATTFGSDRDVASFLAMIPDDSQTLAVLKMSHQSMEAPVVVHMSTDLSDHFAGMPIPNPAEKQISITMSPDTVGVRIFESYEFRSDQESPKPEFAVGASLNLSLKKGELLQSKLTFPSATSWGMPSVSVEERDAIQSRLNSWGVEMQDVPGPTRVDSAQNGGNNITKAALNELRAIVLPDKPSRFSLKGLKQTIENQILRLTKGDRFADRKADKLSTAVATWEKTVLAASDDVGFSSANKEDFKSFLKAEAERYVSQSKNNTHTVANKMTLLLNQLLLRVDLASDLRLNAIDNAPDAVLKMGEGTDQERTYALGDVFAAGSSGMVRSAVLTSADGSKQDVVVKELFVPLMGQTDVPRIVNFSQAVLELLNERALRLDNGTCHPRLAATLDAIVTRDNDGMVKLNICMERLGDSGEKIADSLQSQSLVVRESETKKILKDVGEGLDFMHSKSIMHRDMKPANIAKKEGGYVILDFGAAGRTSSTDTTITAGSAFFRAPEVMIASKETPYTTAADIFSLGVTAFQMIAGTEVAPAFGERTTYPTGEEDTLDQSFNAETLEKAFAKEPWRAVDPKLKGFIQKMLNPDPSQRPTAKAVSEFSFGE